MKTNTSYLADFLAFTHKRRRGSIAILGTLTATALFGMLGLTFDAAYLHHLGRGCWSRPGCARTGMLWWEIRASLPDWESPGRRRGCKIRRFRRAMRHS